MTADVRFWLYLGFFLYTVYCLFTIDPDESDDGGSVGYDPIKDAEMMPSGYKSPEKNVKQRIKLNDHCQKMIRKR